MTDVKAVDVDGQVIADGVMRREGIHHPSLPRCSECHGARLRREMHGEVKHSVRLRAVGNGEHELEVLVVIDESALHLYDLRDRLSGRQEVVHGLVQRCATKEHFRSIGVGCTVEREGKDGT